VVSILSGNLVVGRRILPGFCHGKISLAKSAHLSIISSKKTGGLAMKPGGKLIDKESDTIYVIRNVDQKNILLVSEDGEFSMFLRRDSIVTSGFEPLYD